MSLMLPKNGGPTMAKSKSKKEKPEETTAEFVERMNQHKEWGKHNGIKRKVGRHHR